MEALLHTLAIINGVDSEHVGACIDTGHARIFRFNQGNMARALADMAE